ncbi:tetratricopeptide repeat protein [Patescibacteria group bacterium]|nr:tetratricopeptide repeat protein [Patescibacteria group bacterium]
MNKRVIYALIGLAILLAGTGTVIWLKFFATPTSSSPYEQLQTTNTDFVQAQTAFNSGKWSEAIVLYKQALAKTSDPDQKLAVYYYLAAAENITGQHTEAISLLKQVVAADTMPKETRAYAAQYMGIMTVNLSNTAVHNSIMAEIFKDSPYKEMYAQNDDAISTRHLFEYASSFYPLGISEANIANWYIGDIISKKISTTTEPGLSTIKLIQQKLANASLDIERTKLSTQTSNLIPQIYARKAEVTEGLSRVGVASKEQALRAYADALQSYAQFDTLPADDWFLRFRYAGFLASAYGQIRQSEVHDIVAPLYLNSAYASLTKSFFATLGGIHLTQTPTTSLEGSTLRAWKIGKIDPDFKNFLVSLGWSKNNF